MTMKRFEKYVPDICNGYTVAISIIDNETGKRSVSIDDFVDMLNALYEESLSLKASATMYCNLFLELQRQMKGVTKASDLDSKDFEDLIELSKGNVFDDEIGWIHLPVKELIE